MSLAAAYFFGTPQVPGSHLPDGDPRVDASQPDDPLATIENELERLSEGATPFLGALETAYRSESEARRAARLPQWLQRWSAGQSTIAGTLLLEATPRSLSPDAVVAGLLLAFCTLAFLLSYAKRTGFLRYASFLLVAVATGLDIVLLGAFAWSGTGPSMAAILAPTVSLALLYGAPLPWHWSRAVIGTLAVGSAFAVFLTLPMPDALVVCAGLGLSGAVACGVREHLSRARREAFLLRRKGALQAERNKAEREAMERLATMDALTGIANRRAFDARLIEHLVRARPERPVCVALLDIDYFKALNDAAGHLSGDECLRRVAAALRKAADGDFVARYGGEEFAVLFQARPGEEPTDRLERLRDAVLALGIVHPGRPGEHLTISVGGAMAVQAENSRVVLDRADTALYRAKAEGRNRVAFEAKPEARPADTADLRRLLERAHSAREAVPDAARNRA